MLFFNGYPAALLFRGAAFFNTFENQTAFIHAQEKIHPVYVVTSICRFTIKRIG